MAATRAEPARAIQGWKKVSTNRSLFCLLSSEVTISKIKVMAMLWARGNCNRYKNGTEPNRSTRLGNDGLPNLAATQKTTQNTKVPLNTAKSLAPSISDPNVNGIMAQCRSK